MVKTVLITGANGGLGKDSARQLALLNSTEKIYLGCRNPQKAAAAKRELETATGRSIFEIVLMDMTDLDSVRKAVASLDEPIDGLVMNAGGPGGKNFNTKTADGVTYMFAVNVLGHVVLLEELLQAKKLTNVAVYISSEIIRGIPKMMMKKPEFKTFSADEYASVINGSFFAQEGQKDDSMTMYGYVKYIATMWMSSLARQYPDVRIVTTSPGSTSGTNAADEMGAVLKFIFTGIGTKIMPLFGLMHDLEDGAKRYVDVLDNPSYESGKFYASKAAVVVGPMVDQSTLRPDLNDQTSQDNAHAAIHRFL
jgi:NAD(P)-dependent dehydrogenase (short-subunit alcohol dehydrogenase family)